MRKRVWFTDPPWRPVSHWMTERLQVMNGSKTEVGYYYKGKPANIHGAAIVCRHEMWMEFRFWFAKRKLESIDWSLVFYYLMLTFGFATLAFAVWAVMDLEGMI